MHNSPHDDFRDRLAALAGDAWMLSAGALAGREWTRMFSHFDSRHDVYALFVLESVEPAQHLCHVEVSTVRPAGSGAAEEAEFDPRIGWVRVRTFPSDDVLPTIPHVLSAAQDPCVMRYWPAKRCTIRSGPPGCLRIAKIYPPKYLLKNRGARLHESALALWNASAAGELDFRVAQPVRWDSETLVLWQWVLPGQHATRELFREPRTWGRRMGRAAGSLAGSSLSPARYFDRREQMADSVRYGAELSSRLPSLAPEVHRALQLLSSAHGSHRGERLRPIHGDLHAGQFLIDGENLGLLDFDDFSWGEPERDAAFFLVQAACELNPPFAPDSLAIPFLQGFESAYGPLDPQKLAAYSAHKWLSKALKAACDVRVDGDALAATYLGYALGAAAGDEAYACAARGESWEEVT